MEKFMNRARDSLPGFIFSTTCIPAFCPQIILLWAETVKNKDFKHPSKIEWTQFDYKQKRNDKNFITAVYLRVYI